MDLGIKDKVVLITGSGQGIGKACALSFAREGAIVCVNDVKVENGEAVVKELTEMGAKAKLFPGDISDENAVRKIFDDIHEAFGPVDIMVNNAALSIKTPMDQISADEFVRHMNVNLLGTFLCSKYAIEDMKSNNWGRVISLSSIAGRYGADNAGLHYATTKGGIISMIKTQAKKVAQFNITVNCVAPGRIDTELSKVLPEEIRQKVMNEIPAKRFGTVEEVADVIVFLASQQASYINGACVDVMGGYVA